jgi:hypothetical protein
MSPPALRTIGIDLAKNFPKNPGQADPDPLLDGIVQTDRRAA